MRHPALRGDRVIDEVVSHAFSHGSIRSTENPQSWGSIVKWWEARRLYYNLILLIAPAQVLIFHWSTFKSLTKPWQGILLYLLLYQLPANLWYMGGWMVELFLDKALRLSGPGFAPWALAAGIVFSLLFLFFFRISFSPYTGKFSLF